MTRHAGLRGVGPFVLLACLAVGSSGPGAPDIARLEVDLSAPELGTFELTPAFVAGGPGEADASAFGQVVAVAVGDSGQTFVADWQAKHVVVLGPDGHVVDTLGRAGRAPGEFESISWIDLHPNRDLWAMDPLQRRLTRIPVPEGAAATVPFPLTGYNTSIPWTAEVDEDGTLVVRETRLIGTSAATTVRRYELAVDSLRRIDSLALPPVERPAAVTSADGPVRMRSSPPLAPVNAVTWADPGVWRAWTSGFEIERLDEEGRVESVLVADLLGEPVSRRTRDSLAAAYSMSPDAIPETVPPIVSLDLDAADNLWVGITRDGRSIRGWEVFGPEGVHLASVSLPRAFAVLPGVLDWSGEFLAAVTVGDYDVHRVVTFRLPDPL